MNRLVKSNGFWMATGAALLMAAAPALADQAESRARGPVHYDATITLHEFDPGIQTPHRLRNRDADMRENMPSGPTGLSAPSWNSSGSSGLLPPPPPPPGAEQRKRSWIRPTLESDELRDRDSDSEGPSTGWGWLADEVRQIRAEREGVDPSERDSKANRELGAEEEPRRQGPSNESGLVLNLFGMNEVTEPRTAREEAQERRDNLSTRDRMDSGTPRTTLSETTPVIANLFSDTESQRAVTPSMQDIEPTPWVSSWSVDRMASSLPEPVTGINTLSAPSFRADPIPSTQRVTAWTPAASAGGSWNNSGMGQNSSEASSSASFAPTPWSSGWSADSSWSDTSASRARAAPSTPSSAISGGGLSDFQSRWISGP